MASTLLLGPVLFQDFELPERISWGGKQRLTVHRMPGGLRVIDAMGRDDAQIGWAGVFSGSAAATRARMIDLIRAEGSAWPLIWESFYYSVVLSTFEADYRRANWIPYRISCTVLRDETETAVTAAASLFSNVLADLTYAFGTNSEVDLSESLAALGMEGAATRGAAAYDIALGSLNGAAARIDALIASTGTALAMSTIDTATDLMQAKDTSAQLASLANARGYVRRAQTNLANAST